MRDIGMRVRPSVKYTISPTTGSNMIRSSHPLAVSGERRKGTITSARIRIAHSTDRKSTHQMPSPKMACGITRAPWR